MQKRQNLEEAFRRAGDQLRVNPSSDAWNRLEKRLDRHRQGGARLIGLSTWWAAAAAMLLGILSTVYFLQPSNNRDLLAEGMPVLLEDIEGSGQEGRMTRLDYQGRHIEEGEPGKKLRVNQPREKAVAPKTSKPRPAAPVVEEAVVMEQPEEMEVPEAATEMAEAAGEVPESYEAESYPIRSAPPTGNMREDNDLGTASDDFEKVAAKKAESGMQEQKARVYSAFSWLPGVWETTTPEGLRIEAWKEQNPNLYKGKAYLEKDGKRTLIEEMKLEQEGGYWYFTSTPKPGRQSQVYQLEGYAPNQAIFRNTAPPREQMILDQGTKSRAYRE